MSYSSIAFWLPLTVGLTALGLVLSYLAWRRRGVRAGIRGMAWSLLPVVAYMTGAIEMFWKIGAAIGKFGTSWVFSPVKWAGIALAGLTVVLFVASGSKARRRAARDRRRAVREDRKNAAKPGAPAPGLTGAGASGTAATLAVPTARTPAPAPSKTSAKTPAKSKGAAADDDMKDIEEILRKRGI